ncbi:MAG: hypothetical protein WHS38_00950 [Thermodesulforhabdaceae bacterium]
MELQKSKPPLPHKATRIFLGICVFLSLFLFLLLLNTTAFRNNYAYGELLMLGEKAMLVFHGYPPRLENLGFVYPPLIYVFVLIFQNPFISSAFVGALSASLLLFFTFKAHSIGRIPLSIALVVLLYVLASPASLFLLSEHQSFCLFIGVFLQLVHHLYRYCRFHYTIDLLLFGMMTAFLFFLRFQAMFLIPVLILPFIITKEKQDIGQKMSVAIIAFFPSLFFLGGWSYLNWVFMKDPLYFFRAWLSSMGATSGWNPAGDLKGATIYLFERTKVLLPFVLPIFVAFIRQWKIGFQKCRVTPSILAAPFILIWADALIGATHEHSMSYSILFLVAALSFWVNFPGEAKLPWIDRLFAASMIMSLIFNWTLLGNQHPEEQAFKQALVKPLENSTVGHARAIVKHIRPGTSVLIDDTKGFPVVFIEGDARRFVLPYQYEYETVLSSPHLFVDYVVVYAGKGKTPSEDRIAGRWPEAVFGYLPRFKLAGRYGYFMLYERTEYPFKRVSF